MSRQGVLRAFNPFLMPPDLSPDSLYQQSGYYRACNFSTAFRWWGRRQRIPNLAVDTFCSSGSWFRPLVKRTCSDVGMPIYGVDYHGARHAVGTSGEPYPRPEDYDLVWRPPSVDESWLPEYAHDNAYCYRARHHTEASAELERTETRSGSTVHVQHRHAWFSVMSSLKPA